MFNESPIRFLSESDRSPIRVLSESYRILIGLRSDRARTELGLSSDSDRTLVGQSSESSDSDRTHRTPIRVRSDWWGSVKYWYLEMSRVFMKELGYKRSRIDHLVFYKKTSDEHTIVAVATDDMAVTSKQVADTENFKSEIKKYWEITDHRPIKWFLGFEIKRDQKSRMIAINQWAYIEKMVERFSLTNAKRVPTPMEPNIQFSIDQCPSTPNQLARMKGVPYS